MDGYEVWFIPWPGSCVLHWVWVGARCGGNRRSCVRSGRSVGAPKMSLDWDEDEKRLRNRAIAALDNVPQDSSPWCAKRRSKAADRLKTKVFPKW